MDLKLEIPYLLDLWTTSPRCATNIVKKQNPELFNKINEIDGKSFSEKVWKIVHQQDAVCCDCGHKLYQWNAKQ